MDFGSMAQVAGEVTWEEQIGNSLVVREPIGVVGCITPWNYPLHQICAKVAPALTAGCSVVVKPSEVTPLTSFILAEIIDSLDLPAGAVPLPPERVAFVPDFDAVPAELVARARPGDLVLTLGAGSVTELGPRVLDLLRGAADA